MNIREIIPALATVLNNAATLAPARGERMQAIATRITDLTVEDDEVPDNDLEALFIEAAELLNVREVKFAHQHKLGIEVKLRHLIAYALQRCLAVRLQEIGHQCTDIGWEIFGNRLEDIEAKLLLGGALESQEQAARWSYFVVDICARIQRARKAPAIDLTDPLAEEPPTTNELDHLQNTVGEFCIILDLLVRWFPR